MTEDVEKKDRSRQRRKQIFRVGWLIDGLGGAVAEDRVITIEQGCIESIVPYRASGQPSPGLIDLTDATIMPALMDAHVHLALSGTLNADLRQAQLAQSPERVQESVKTHLQAHLDHGIVAVRDAGDKWGQVPRVRSTQHLPVHLAATCWAWHAPGRYGRMIGRAPDPGESLAQAVMRTISGADHIKLIQSGINSLDRFGLQTAPQFSEDELAPVSLLARQAGLPVMVHANGEAAVQSALAAGCDSIEHGYFMGRDNLGRMADRQVFWVPTAVPMAALTRDGVVSPAHNDVARRTLDHQLEQIATARGLGVRIALGTDAGSLGVDHGTAVRRELRLLMAAGLSVGEAVKCATFNAARLMRLNHRGALQTGWGADFIAIHGDPQRLPTSLEDIFGMCIHGRWRQHGT